MNEEMLKRAKGAKSAAELKSLAAGAGLTLTDEQATEYYAKISHSGELADEELDNVAGGGCGAKNDVPTQYMNASDMDFFTNIECGNCHAKPVYVDSMCPDMISSNLRVSCTCPGCGHKFRVEYQR